MVSVFGEGVRVSLNVIELSEDAEYYVDILDRIAALCRDLAIVPPKVIQIFSSDPSGSCDHFVLFFDQDMESLDAMILVMQDASIG